MPTRGMRIAKANDTDIKEMIAYFLKREERRVRIPVGWRRIVWGYDVLANNCADATEDHLEFCPYLNGHVAAEQ